MPFSPEYHQLEGQTAGYLLEMRNLIMISEGLLAPEMEEPVEEEAEDTVPVDTHDPIIDMLNDLVFKMRSHTENEDGEYAVGYEAAMSAASDMIENVIRRVQEGR